MRTEWSATDNRWWPLAVVASLVVAGVPLLLDVVARHQPLWSLVAFPVAALLNIVGTARGRLRLTDAGVEVRRLRTRLYPWADIASAERAPEWDGSRAIWLRLRTSVPSADPEVLVPPGLRTGDGADRTLDDLVALIRRRAGLEHETRPA